MQATNYREVYLAIYGDGHRDTQGSSPYLGISSIGFINKGTNLRHTLKIKSKIRIKRLPKIFVDGDPPVILRGSAEEEAY